VGPTLSSRICARAEVHPSETRRAFALAQEVIERAIENPLAPQTDAWRVLLKNRVHLPEQRVNVIYPDTQDYWSNCVRRSEVDGRWTEYSGFVNTGSCWATFGPNGMSPASCVIHLCPAAFRQDMENLVHVILHELDRVTIGMNECHATYGALMAERLAGMAPQMDGYVQACRLGHFH
jgi:hypothetical protein